MSIVNIAVISPGDMGSKIALRLVQSGSGPVLTNLDGRSGTTRTRAQESGMLDVSYGEIARKSDWILSIVPPRDAFEIAEKVVKAFKALPVATSDSSRQIVYADCNAVNSDTVKKIGRLFEGTPIIFIDGAIIGGPPSPTYNPIIYAAAAGKDEQILDQFQGLSRLGLNIYALKGEGAGIGDASALKMAHSVRFNFFVLLTSSLNV